MPPGRRDRSGPSRYPRTARVNQVLREVVAEELERLADVDERLRLLTVTAVDTAPDLRRATVYLSSLPEEAVAALADRRVHLQRALAGQMRLKRTPQLVFVADPAVRSGEQVDQILRRIQPAAGPEVPGLEGASRGDAGEAASEAGAAVAGDQAGEAASEAGAAVAGDQAGEADGAASEAGAAGSSGQGMREDEAGWPTMRAPGA